MTRTAFGCSGLGWLPALATSTRPPAAAPGGLRRSGTGRCCRCRETAPAPAPCAGGRRGGAAAPPRPGCSAAPVAASSCPQRAKLDAVVAVPAIGRAASHRHQPAVAQPAQVVGHERSAADRPSRSAPPPAGRCGPARTATASAADHPRAAGTPAAKHAWAASSGHARRIHQTGLMHQARHRPDTYSAINIICLSLPQQRKPQRTR